MDLYQLNLAGLLGLCAVLFAAQLRRPARPATRDGQNAGPASKAAGEGGASQLAFLVVYALVMASDWLQGPFLYSLYADEHAVPPHLVSALFTTGFLAGGVSAYFVGALADRHGRRAACLLFCAASAASCLLTCAPSAPLLFAGRCLGGAATSLLFSAFESWMVADFRARGLAAAGGDLSRTFGAMGALNGCVAIASGVFSEWAVAAAGTRKAPFVASAGLLGVAAWVIATRWAENYGEAAPAAGEKTSVWSLLGDPRIVALGLASTLFEGSMYLFVFFWAPALQSARRASPPGAAAAAAATPPPYGLVFASFMACTLAASLAFSLAAGRGPRAHARLLLGVLLAADACFYALGGGGGGGGARGEQGAFWLFCAFEACVGLYWPCMGYLRGRLVDDAARARVYGALRVPLNVFVVVSLMLTRDGAGDAHGAVFAACSKLLVPACGGIWALILSENGLP